MRLDRLYVRNLRNVREALLEPGPTLNLIYGANGAGKTSLLEAVSVLLAGRSFRSHRFKPLVTEGESAGQILADVCRNGQLERVSVLRGRDDKPVITVSGEPVSSIAKLAAQYPVATMEATLGELITGPPARRRRYLDWGLFHVEHSFYEAWRRAERALKQRNELLRRGKLSSFLSTWSGEYGRYGAEVDRLRRHHFDLLEPLLQQWVAKLAPSLDDQVAFHYLRGWSGDTGLDETLAAAEVRDIQLGQTRFGPHRADVRILSGGRPASDVLSRGQIKLVSCAMKLAQIEMVATVGVGVPLVLIDDLPAELDLFHRGSLVEAALNAGGQSFVTCISPDELGATKISDATMFHVEHGAVQRA